MNRLIRRRCVDMVQPGCTITGGLSEFHKIAMLCSIANIRCIPHIRDSGVALATRIHAVFSRPHYPPAPEPATVYPECKRTGNIFREELAAGIPQLENGLLPKPEGPGLHIEINEDILRRYAV